MSNNFNMTIVDNNNDYNIDNNETKTIKEPGVLNILDHRGNTSDRTGRTIESNTNIEKDTEIDETGKESEVATSTFNADNIIPLMKTNTNFKKTVDSNDNCTDTCDVIATQPKTMKTNLSGGEKNLKISVEDSVLENNGTTTNDVTVTQLEAIENGISGGEGNVLVNNEESHADRDDCGERAAECCNCLFLTLICPLWCPCACAVCISWETNYYKRSGHWKFLEKK
eukprot:Awhi_evm1s3902